MVVTWWIVAFLLSVSCISYVKKTFMTTVLTLKVLVATIDALGHFETG